MPHVFYARRNRSTVIGLSIGFLIIAVSVAGPILYAPMDELENPWNLLIPGIFILFFLYVLTVSLLKLFMTYTVTSKGIQVYRPPFHRHLFRAEGIKEVKCLSQEETNKMMSDSIMEQESFKDGADIAGYIRLLRTKSPAWRYFTIAPTARVTTIGSKELITSLELKSFGGMLVVKMKDNSEFFISPSSPEDMKKSIDDNIHLG